MSNRIKDSYEDGVCPDCSKDIPDDVIEGEECSNCGHVFMEEEDYDDMDFYDYDLEDNIQFIDDDMYYDD